jgi:hypothetical protein
VTRRSPAPPSIPAGLESLLPAFILEMQKDYAVLEALAAAGGPPFAAAVHAMRGKCAMFGEDILFRLLTALEQPDGSDPAILAAIGDRVGDLLRCRAPD